ncbi:hypothetical protein BHE90_009509 [Fusarium euwallaceae]|uniref:Peptidase M20 domain-containing protein 2 n=1 Tax=Fusarium euwallaceae TaxID=1147111 RepID=A0A430LJZ2_9HYPO|nr:hypothetical protein BHE90_009509 [Fusarium euwallaceae]
MTQTNEHPTFSFGLARRLIDERLSELSLPLRQEISLPLHENPETAYKEFFAHDLIVNYLASLGFQIKKSTWKLQTSFEAIFGDGGRQVVFCAEYDALPDLGHACGHNLIACSSVGAFLGAAHVMAKMKIPGRLRLLGTPAEEGLCGKSVLIDAGAFNPPEDIAAAIMAHAIPASLMNFGPGVSGIAGFKFNASHIFKVEFTGQAAHAAGEPWKGVNALDAAVGAYTNIALLRQQTFPDERIHGVIEHGGMVPGIIPDYSRMMCSPTFMNMRANGALCGAYVEDMASFGANVVMDAEPTAASTDMGNVSHIVPSFHGGFVIPAEPTTTLHTPEFAAAAKTEEAHDAAIKAAMGMAMMAVRVLVDDNIAAAARADFEKDDDV